MYRVTTTVKAATVAVLALMLVVAGTGCSNPMPVRTGSAVPQASAPSVSTSASASAGSTGSGSGAASGSGTGASSVAATATAGASVVTSPAAVPLQPTRPGAVAPPATGAYVGVFRPPAPFNRKAMASYSSISSKRPAIIMWYQQWAYDEPHEFDPAAVVSLYDRGIVPMITWEPWDPGKNANFALNGQDQKTYQLANIVGGKFDPYIQQFARDVKSVRGPVMIRPMHEMNGNWYPWCGTVNGNTPAEYIAAWRHIHDIFVQEGATNVTWVWSINHESIPNTPANAFSAYYPGDAYVDWTSVSGFNWGTTTPVEQWRTFDFWYRTPLTYLGTLGKPIIISEFASVEQGGDKAAWITDAYTRIRTEYPRSTAWSTTTLWRRGRTRRQDWRPKALRRAPRLFRGRRRIPTSWAGRHRHCRRGRAALGRAAKAARLLPAHLLRPAKTAAREERCWCPGWESNPHEVSPRGF